MSRMSNNDKVFIADVIDRAIKNKVRVVLHNKKYFREPGESPYGGYFCGDDREFLCSTGMPFQHWFSIFIHESCHMDQFTENAKIWTDCFKGEEDVSGKLFDWLDNDITMSKADIAEATRLSLELELDCEKRVVERIKEWDLSLDIETYVKRANAYVLFYNFVKKHRLWTAPGRPPYKCKAIVDRLPGTFTCNYKVLPKWFEEELINYTFKGDLEGEKKRAAERRRKNSEKLLAARVVKHRDRRYYPY